MGNKARNAMGEGIGLAPSNFQNNAEIRNPKTGWNNELVLKIISHKHFLLKIFVMSQIFTIFGTKFIFKYG